MKEKTKMWLSLLWHLILRISRIINPKIEEGIEETVDEIDNINNMGKIKRNHVGHYTKNEIK